MGWFNLQDALIQEDYNLLIERLKIELEPDRSLDVAINIMRNKNMLNQKHIKMAEKWRESK